MARMHAHITPSVIKWARVSASFDITQAAKKIGRPEADIVAWELGEAFPSFAQLRRVSEVYKRPIAVFYLPEPPTDFQTLRDFRRISGQPMGRYSPELTLLIRETQQRQAWLSEVIEETGDSPLWFIGAADQQTPVDVVANTIRETLGISIVDLSSFETRASALRSWIQRIENAGIYVFQAGNMRGKKVSPDEARGFALSNEFAPFIFLNAQDSKSAQLFTLAHELAHLWLNQPGVSNLDFRVPEPQQYDPIEVVCNRIAAEILLPARTFLRELEKAGSGTNLKQILSYFSAEFKVSEYVVARRLLDFGRISSNAYSKIVEELYQRWAAFMEDDETNKSRNRHGGPSPHLMKVINNGRAFTRKVLSFYQMGTFSLRDVTLLLNAKVNHLEKIASHAEFPLTRSGRNE